MIETIYRYFPLTTYYILSVLFVVIVVHYFKNRSDQKKTQFLYILCFINFVAYVVNLYYFYLKGQHLLTMLPLQLCNIAVFLIPLSIAYKKQLLMDFAFYLCLPGALAAILIPSNDYEIVYSGITVSFYIFHGLIFFIPILMSYWKFYQPAPSIKKGINLTIMTLGLGAVMHGFNVFMNTMFSIPANYFFTMMDLSAPTNPAFALFASWIPFDYFYLLPSLLVLYVYMLVLFSIKKKPIA